MTLMFTCLACHRPYDFLADDLPAFEACRPCLDRASLGRAIHEAKAGKSVQDYPDGIQPPTPGQMSLF